MAFTPPATADDLQDLLRLLYPDPPIVDILTLDDFKYRYQFSRLGAGAVASLERAQRITRDMGDYDQMGLSEFHSGLIHLYEQQFLGAAHYFIEARRYWDFADRKPTVCLAHFALGAAQQHAFHYERALSSYGKVDKCLSQFPVDDLTAVDGPFWAALREQLAVSRQDVLRKMRAMEEGDGDGSGSGSGNGRLPLPIPPADLDTRPVAGLQAPVAEPIFRLNRGSTGTGSPPPLNPDTPIPDHTNLNNYFIWYQAVSRSDEAIFLPDIRANTWFLVDRRLERYVVTPGDLVIVDNATAEGSIEVSPQPPSVSGRRRPRIHLGKVESPNLIRFTRDVHTGTVSFAPWVADEIADKGKVSLGPTAELPLYADEIVGIVIGIWGNLDATLV